MKLHSDALEILRMEPPNPEQAERLAVFVKRVSRGASEDDVGETERRQMHWKLSENPYLAGLAHVVVQADTQQVVGSISLIPKPIWAWGEPVVWGEIGDAMTDETVRRQGLFTRLHDSITASATQHGFNAMYGLPNDQSGPGFLKCGWLTKENADLVVCRYLTGSVRLADAVTSRAPNNPLIALAGRAIRSDLVDGAAKLAKRARRGRQSTEFAIGPSDGFGPDFDHLWERARDRIGFGMVRDHEFLTWRFKQNPAHFQTIVARNGDELVGYLVTYIQQSAHRSQATLVIADWLYDPAAGPRVATDLLRAAMSTKRSVKIEAVTATTTKRSPFPLPWSKFGFRVSPFVKPMILFHDEVGERVVADAGPWHYTTCDSD